MKTIITHFDGDPFLLNFWLKLYAQYWRGEADQVLLSIFYKKELIPEQVLEFNRSLLAEYPEIKVFWQDYWEIPEAANAFLLKQVTEGLVGFVESDGFIFGRGLVAQMFRLLEEGQEVVCPDWALIDDPYVNGDLGCEGFMRCFFFTKKEVLDKIEVDFFPKTIPAGTLLPNSEYRVEKDIALDCFGWISLQLATLRLKRTVIPANLLHPDNLLDATPYAQFKWCHVRQMSSSALGLGGGEYGLWREKDRGHLINRVFDLLTPEMEDGPAGFIYKKALAFRRLFWDTLENKEALGDFAGEYKTVLDTVTDLYNFNREEIAEQKGFWKGVMGL